MKMLQEYWASTVIFIGIFSQCTHEKKSKTIWELWAIYRLSNGATNNFWALPIFVKDDIEVGGC